MKLFLFGGPRLPFGFRTGVSVRPDEIASWFRRDVDTEEVTGSFLYVIEDPMGHCKVGVSQNPIQRLRDLQTGHPMALRLSWAAVTPGTGYNIESHVKRTTGQMRMSGEWFEASVDSMAFLVLQSASILNEPIQVVPVSEVGRIVRASRAPMVERAALPFNLRRPVLFTFLVSLAFTTLIFFFLRAG
jgi:hypothetical protein